MLYSVKILGGLEQIHDAGYIYILKKCLGINQFLKYLHNYKIMAHYMNFRKSLDIGF